MTESRHDPGPPLVNHPSKITRILARTGMHNARNMYWCRSGPRRMNFGDYIGPYIFWNETGKKPIHCSPSTGGLAKTMLSAGSIMGAIKRARSADVWGSGIMFHDEVFDPPAVIHAVRGPRTRDRCLQLGYDCPEIYGDPGILVPDYIPPAEKRFRVGVIPHYVDAALAACLFRGLGGVALIDVDRPVESVVADITACEMTLSSSLHGLILSHAYGIPSAWVSFSTKIAGDGVKFLDYFESAGVVASHLRPRELARPCELTDLLRMVGDAPSVDLEPLRPGLRAACPFRSRKNGSG